MLAITAIMIQILTQLKKILEMIKIYNNSHHTLIPFNKMRNLKMMHHSTINQKDDIQLEKELFQQHFNIPI